MGARARLGPLLASGRTARPPGVTILVGELGALLTLVGSFLPWAIRGDETVSGISDYGAATLALGVAGAALLGAPYLKGMEGVPFRVAAIGAVLCGTLAVVAVSYDMSDISRLLPPVQVEQHIVASPEPGVGLRVTLAGGALLALGGFATALAKPRPRWAQGRLEGHPRA